MDTARPAASLFFHKDNKNSLIHAPVAPRTRGNAIKFREIIVRLSDFFYLCIRFDCDSQFNHFPAVIFKGILNSHDFLISLSSVVDIIALPVFLYIFSSPFSYPVKIVYIPIYVYIFSTFHLFYYFFLPLFLTPVLYSPHPARPNFDYHSQTNDAPP
jgi:hypothetical protein